MNDGWPYLTAVVCIAFGLVLGGIFAEMDRRQSTRAGVMVIDGTAYVLVPARRGGE